MLSGLIQRYEPVMIMRTDRKHVDQDGNYDDQRYSQHFRYVSARRSLSNARGEVAFRVHDFSLFPRKSATKERTVILRSNYAVIT